MRRHGQVTDGVPTAVQLWGSRVLRWTRRLPKRSAARDIITRRRVRTEIEADGGIRRERVPLIAAAGADYIVPGSLMFREDPAQMRRWLATL